MQVTLTIPDELAAELIAAGKDPSRTALEALTAEYHRLLDLASHADAREGIRQGLDQLNRGEGRPASEFFAEMREKYGIPG
jgi:post-segregation antitoxin (ccd killing protein)